MYMQMWQNHSAFYTATLLLGAMLHRMTMKARFTSKCPACDEMIRVGREIAKDSQDRWVHKHCSDEVEELP